MLTIGAKDALRKEDLPFTFGNWVLWAPVVVNRDRRRFTGTCMMRYDCRTVIGRWLDGVTWSIHRSGVGCWLDILGCIDCQSLSMCDLGIWRSRLYRLYI